MPGSRITAPDKTDLGEGRATGAGGLANSASELRHRFLGNGPQERRATGAVVSRRTTGGSQPTILLPSPSAQTPPARGEALGGGSQRASWSPF